MPTPEAIVEKMLQMAKVGRDDVLYDLGCGDGRVVSHNYGMGDWEPQEVAEVEVGTSTHYIYSWVVPDR
ncbi:MAG TPA: hypothetical protein VGB76_16950 [Pyrinomonadaceae bacterium]